METITGRVTKVYNNCPKVSGWFGCHFDADGRRNSLRVTGNYRGPLDTGMRFVMTGEYKTNSDFEVVEMRPILPSGRDFVRYLKSVKGVGSVTAQKIYDKYGTDTAYIIEFEKDKLKTDLKLSDKIITALHTAVTGESPENQISKACPFLTPSVVSKLADAYCMDYMHVFTNKPYSILYDVQGIGFDNVDKIAMQFGTKYNDRDRLKECVCYALYQYMNDTGHMYLNLLDSDSYNIFWRQYIDNVMMFKKYSDTLSRETIDMAAVTAVFTDFAFKGNDEERILNEHGRLYLTYVYKQERDLAQTLAEIADCSSFIFASDKEINAAVSDYERMTGKTLDNEQREAVVTAMTNRISVITGGPGRGKTDTIACIMHVWRKFKSKAPVLCAPTGMAVKKLKDSTHGDVMTAMYRIVKDSFVESGGLTAATYNSELAKKTANLFIVDEASMFDWFTAYNIVNIYRNCQIVFVGDPNQLPPIGKGQFFRDLCSSDKIRKTTLLTNHRSRNLQSISDNADKVKEGIASDNFVFDNAFHGIWSDDRSSMCSIVDIYMDHVKNSVGMIDNNKLMNVCLISPTRYGCTGVVALNLRIQDEVNPKIADADVSYKTISTSTKGTPIKGLPFGDSHIRVGSRVMITKNQRDEAGQLVFYNGECGFITRYELDSYGSETIIFRSDATGEYKTIENKGLQNITLAYAITVHKSQGSEYDTVIFAAQDSLIRMPDTFACRNLVYTAITRAKKEVYVVGDKDAFDRCIYNEQPLRNTRLVERIADFS